MNYQRNRIGTFAGCTLAVAAALTPAYAQFCGFSAPARIELSGTAVMDLAVGDLDSDGDADVVARTFTTFAVLLNNGDGVLVPGASFTSSGSPDALALGDIDIDKDLDIVVPSESSPDGMRVFLNQGNGVFVPGATFAGGGSCPEELVLLDLEPDGDPDVVLVNTASPNLSVLVNNGSGSFGAPTLIPVAAAANAIATGQLNDDGWPDLAVAHDQTTDAVTILLNQGDGTFGAAVVYPAGDAPISIGLADWDLDTDLDFATVTFSPTTIGIGLNQGDGTFAPTMVFPHGNGGAFPDLAAGDLDGDLDPDLAVASNATNYVKVWLSNGDGTFASAGTFGGARDGRRVAMADLNGDGVNDVVTGTAAPPVVEVFLSQPSLPADVNGDCSVDLADWAAFAPCLTGPDGGLPPGCDAADLDADNDVDLHAAAVFQSAFTGQL